MRLSKRGVVSEIETKARAMARSGIYQNFRAIQRRLVDVGYPEAEKLFQNAWQQDEIDRICGQCFQLQHATSQAA